MSEIIEFVIGTCQEGYLTLHDLEGYKRRSAISDSAIFIADHKIFILKGKVYREAPS